MLIHSLYGGSNSSKFKLELPDKNDKESVDNDYKITEISENESVYDDQHNVTIHSNVKWLINANQTPKLAMSSKSPQKRRKNYEDIIRRPVNIDRPINTDRSMNRNVYHGGVPSFNPQIFPKKLDMNLEVKNYSKRNDDFDQSFRDKYKILLPNGQTSKETSFLSRN